MTEQKLKYNGDSELIEDFMSECEIRGLTSETIRGYKSNLLIFKKFMNSQGLSILDIDKRTLKEFLKYLKSKRVVKEKTLGNYFSAISSFCDHLMYEEKFDRNPVLPFRKRYIKIPKRTYGESQRKLISVDEMSMLVNAILDPRDRAIVVLFAKTGIRRGELINIDIDDISWIEQSIKLKDTAKRTNLTIFFDNECSRALRRWIRAREHYDIEDGCEALFISIKGKKLERMGIYRMIVKYATKVKLHKPESNKLGDHFTPHCFRHWFTTHLRRNGMPREYIKELRGDSRDEAIDIYHHIDRRDLRESYLACIPQLGI